MGTPAVEQPVRVAEVCGWPNHPTRSGALKRTPWGGHFSYTQASPVRVASVAHCLGNRHTRSLHPPPLASPAKPPPRLSDRRPVAHATEPSHVPACAALSAAATPGNQPTRRQRRLHTRAQSRSSAKGRSTLSCVS